MHRSKQHLHLMYDLSKATEFFPRMRHITIKRGPHLALQKDAPLHRAIQRTGTLVAISILAGPHHQYVRI
jgi:hypothetical protein